jgi:LuxR family maltose regulon positive regulatory protein
VSRPRLLTLLDTGTRQLLTVVSGPAGAGKTTLLTSWSSAGQPPGPVAWLSLNPADDEPARFWTYLQAALCRSGAVPAGSTLRSLAPRPGLDESFLSLLVSGLAELPTPVVLVLDDVQDITDPAVFQGLEFLLRHGPEQLRLVLSTRVDPPLPLHRLLVSGQLSQVRSADLAFTVTEVAELLAEHEFQPRLDERDAALLQARTEGWAVGLRLAALSLQDQPDPRRFVAEFAGDDRSVADYLVGEVLDRQPEGLRRFLLQTCIVEELSGDLADALTGGRDGEWTLARLERANAFVAALGPRRDAYRYHRLFAGLLRCELRRQAPEQVAGLHRRAARWYAANGLVADAIRQALLAGEWRDAADLMAEHGLHLILHGAAGILDELLAGLPAGVAQADPELALLVAAGGIVRGDHETAAVHLRLAQQQEAPSPEDRRGRFGWLLVTCRTALAWQVGDLDEALAAGREALALPAEAGGADDDTRAVLLSSLGSAELWSGRLDAAEIHLRQGRHAALRAGLGSLQLGCMSQLAVLQAMRGALGQAARLAGEAVELATQRGWSSSAQAAGGHLALAWVHFHRDDLIEAGHDLERAAAASRARPERPVALGVAILQARLQQVRGDLAGSLATVAAARGDATGWTPPAQLRRWLTLTEAELHSAAGQPGPVPALLDGVDQGGPLGAAEAVVLARLQLAGGDPAAASVTLAPCLDGTAPGGLVAPVEAWLLDAFVGDALAEHDRAAASLQRALSLAEAEGFRRSLLDAGAPCRSLLTRYRHRLATSGFYLDELLQASVESVHAEGSPPALVGQLTKQERVVLRYLPSSMTYEEIATDLYLSPNTVKSHVYSVFRKLGVNGRRHAVRSARELRLL